MTPQKRRGVPTRRVSTRYEGEALMFWSHVRTRMLRSVCICALQKGKAAVLAAVGRIMTPTTVRGAGKKALGNENQAPNHLLRRSSDFQCWHDQMVGSNRIGRELVGPRLSATCSYVRVASGDTFGTRYVSRTMSKPMSVIFVEASKGGVQRFKPY